MSTVASAHLANIGFSHLSAQTGNRIEINSLLVATNPALLVLLATGVDVVLDTAGPCVCFVFAWFVSDSSLQGFPLSKFAIFSVNTVIGQLLEYLSDYCRFHSSRKRYRVLGVVSEYHGNLGLNASNLDSGQKAKDPPALFAVLVLRSVLAMEIGNPINRTYRFASPRS